MTRSGFWNFSLKTGTSSMSTTRFPCRSVLLRLIVMGVVGTAALAGDPTGGFAAGVADTPAIGDAVEQGLSTGLGIVLHSRIDVAGTVVVGVAAAPAAGAGLVVDLHSRIDVAGVVVPTGASAAA